MRLSDRSELFLANQVAVVVSPGRRNEYSQTGLARLVRVFPTNIFLRRHSLLDTALVLLDKFQSFFLSNGKLKNVYVFFFLLA